MRNFIAYFFIFLISTNISFADDRLPNYLIELKKKADSGDSVSQNDMGHISDVFNMFCIPRALFGYFLGCPQKVQKEHI